MNDSNIIDPKNIPAWVATTFILTLLALGVSSISLYRTNVSLALTQVQLLKVNQELADLRSQPATPLSASAQGAVPAATATK